MIMADPQPEQRANSRGSQSIGNLQRNPSTYSRRRPFNQETHQIFFKRLQQPASNNRFGVPPDGLCAVDSDCAGYPMSYCDAVCKCINGALHAASTCVAGAPALSAATCSSGQIYVTEAGSCITNENALHRALFESDMHASGQLNADLALSDSDDESLTEAERPRFVEDQIDQIQLISS